MAARLCTVDGRRSRQLERPWTSTGRDEALHPTSTGTGASDAAANSAEYCDAGDRYANHGASDACVDGPLNGPGRGQLGGLGAGWRGRERRRGRPRHRGRWGRGWGGGGGRLGRRGGARGASEGAPGALQRRRFLHVFCSHVRPCMHVWVPGRRPGVPLRCPHRWPAGECAGGVVRNLF